MNVNGYCVKGTLRMLQEGNMDLNQAVEHVNMWIELTVKRFYAEGMLDGKKSIQKKSWQAVRDMCPESDYNDAVSVCKGIEVQSYHLVKKEG